jgi:ATP/maltotriose-dependent transcriptional regulator MalT
LTRLLDQTEARVVMLVAPAGYGKTILAQQWVRDKPHVWYRATAASADVAALVLGIARASANHAPGAEPRLAERLTASIEPARDVSVLAEMLADELNSLPDGSCLMIDDFHLAAASPIVDDLVWQLISLLKGRLVLTARTRPRWATARRLLYGEVFELSQGALAMAPDEADSLLSLRRSRVPPGLAALAQGWPAVLGLAALTADTPPAEEMPDALYDFFAEELYQTIAEPLREKITRLALVPSLDSAAIKLLLGDESTEVLATGVRVGFLTRFGDGQVCAHPLVQAFLEKKLGSEPEKSIPVADETARLLMSASRWDDAFSLVERFQLAHLLEPLISASLADMIGQARLTTLERWVSLGRHKTETSPIFDLAEAELAYRRASYARAETLALQAADGLEPEHPLFARAFIVAGHAAHLSDREEAGVRHHSHALNAALTESDKREALWGKLICANQLDLPEVPDLIRELEDFGIGAPKDRLRLATVRFVVGLRGEGISDALAAQRTAYPLLGLVSDPLVRTGFLHSFARCLGLGGFYEDASRIADELIADAERHRVDFVLPHALVAKAIAEIGARRVEIGLRLLDQAEELAFDLNDIHNQWDVQAVRCRALCTAKRFDEALANTSLLGTGANEVVQGEYEVSRALAIACAGDGVVALQLSAEAKKRSPSHEIHGLADWVAAIVALRRDDRALLDEAFDASSAAAVFDGFIVAYRAFPGLLKAIVDTAGLRDRAIAIVRRVGDEQIARRMGFSPPTPHQLSPREREVYELIVEGQTNKEIAATLFITEVTAKVHVRNILRKLGARSRTEAAVRGVIERLQ